MSRKTRNALAEGKVIPSNSNPSLVPIEKGAKPKKKAAAKRKPSDDDEDTGDEDADLEKAEDDEEESEFFEIHKDVSGAIRAARRAAGVSEQAAATALGVDIDTYTEFEDNGGSIDITGEAIAKLAKAFKMKPEELAAQMLSTSPAASPESSDNGTGTSGDQATPPADPVAKAKAAGSRQQKALLKSSQIQTIRITEPDQAAELAEMPIEKRKEVVYSRFAKSLFTPDGLKNFKKSGLITADMFGPNSAIDPVLATSLVNLFVDESALLKQMQVKPMAGKKQNVNVLDVPSRSATRLTSNTWPDSSTGTVPLNPSLMLDAEKMQFSWIIDDDTIMTYIGNMPGLENELTGSFTSALQNDILDLGLNGTGGTWSGSFVNLNKGWFQLAIGGPDSGTGGINAATPAGQVLDVSTNGYTNLEDTLDAILAAAYNPSNANARFFDDSTPFLVGSYDWQLFKTQMKAAYPNFPIPLAGLNKQFEEHPVVTTNKLAQNYIMFTALRNLVIGIVTGIPGSTGDGFKIERFRVIGATRFVATVYLDYGVVNANAVVLAKP
jgi:transcriptional regulator with XRE-family HTH domain